MLTLTIPGSQRWDPNKEEFQYTKPVELRLEHSLVSLAKWEFNWHIPFLSNSGTLTPEQQLDYVRCMTVTQGVDPDVYQRLTKENHRAINQYIDDPATATWFRGEPKPNEPKSTQKPRPKPRARHGRTETTAEVLYCQMFQLGIPKECEKWHLNRLLTLLRVCQEVNMPPKKIPRGEAMAQQRLLNEQRKARLHTKG